MKISGNGGKLAIGALALTLLAGCAQKNDTQANGAQEEAKNAQTQTAVANDKKATEEKSEVAAGEIAKLGLGFDTTLKTTDQMGEKGASAQADGMAVAVGFDTDGKIVDLRYDVIQPKVEFSNDGAYTAPAEAASSKLEKGASYGMKEASEIEKEWDEQSAAISAYAIGKTVEEIEGIATKEKDEHHKAVPDVADLASSVTIDIGAFQKLVREAYDNAQDASGGEKVGLKLTADTQKSKGVEGEKGPKAAIEISAAAVVIDKDEKITASRIDISEPTAEFDAAGKVKQADAEIKSKRDLGDAYQMKEASEIKKEWYEQADAFEAYVGGKTAEEVLAIPTKEKDEHHKAVPDVADLASSVTIDIGDLQKLVQGAVENASK